MGPDLMMKPTSAVWALYGQVDRFRGLCSEDDFSLNPTTGSPRQGGAFQELGTLQNGFAQQ
jgi:hypothetical protein